MYTIPLIITLLIILTYIKTNKKDKNYLILITINLITTVTHVINFYYHNTPINIFIYIITILTLLATINYYQKSKTKYLIYIICLIISILGLFKYQTQCILTILFITFIIDISINKEKNIYSYLNIITTLLTYIITNNLMYSITSYTIINILLIYLLKENPDTYIKKNIEIKDNYKTKFLLNTSYEIKNNITPVIAFCKDSLNEKELSDTLKNNLFNIESASYTILDIINNIQDIENVEKGLIKVNEKDINVEKLLKDINTNITYIIGSKNINYKFNIENTLPISVIGDYYIIKRLILNILIRSIKNNNKGAVNFNISSSQKEDYLNFNIAIESIGNIIKKDNKDLDSNLIYIDKLANIIDSSITYTESNNSTKYNLVLNLKPSPKDITFNFIKDQNKELIPFDGTKYRILIVDDNNLNIKVACLKLNKYNFKVDSCNDGKECLNLIENGNKYDLILMDYMMPNMDGIQTFNNLKEIDNFNTPVVIVTANTVPGIKDFYLKKGFASYIAKPIIDKELDKVLKDILLK